MGYVTNYSLSAMAPVSLKEVKGVDAQGNPASVFIEQLFDIDAVKRQLKDLSGYRYLFEDSCKWYDHEEHMREISIEYRDVLFVLEGEGEENTDIWIKYFKNGKMQDCRAKIVFDDFDESKLS